MNRFSELEELVVRAEREGVLALEQREVVGELDDVLVERVGGREVLGAGHDVDAGASVDA